MTQYMDLFRVYNWDNQVVQFQKILTLLESFVLQCRTSYTFMFIMLAYI